MQEEFYERIRGILSVERLEAYGDDGAERVVVLARYLLNMALCESLYAPLQCFEVALRNSMHSCLSSIAGCENWYNSGTIQFTDWAGIQIKNAERQIVKNRKPITPGRIVAELNFGFWTSLLEDHYERITNFLPKGIKTVFPQ